MGYPQPQNYKSKTRPQKSHENPWTHENPHTLYKQTKNTRTNTHQKFVVVVSSGRSLIITRNCSCGCGSSRAIYLK